MTTRLYPATDPAASLDPAGDTLTQTDRTAWPHTLTQPALNDSGMRPNLTPQAVRARSSPDDWAVAKGPLWDELFSETSTEVTPKGTAAEGLGAFFNKLFNGVSPNDNDTDTDNKGGTFGQKLLLAAATAFLPKIMEPGFLGGQTVAERLSSKQRLRNPQQSAYNELMQLLPGAKYNPDGTFTELATRLSREAGIPAEMTSAQLDEYIGTPAEPSPALANGGPVYGPGTGTSDSIPARLSDGEFVMTANAVNNAGGGSNALGAARMYEAMRNLENRGRLV